MEETITRLCKGGDRNVFARIPDEAREKFFPGDKVRIVLLEKAVNRADHLENAIDAMIKGLDAKFVREVFKKCLAGKG